MLKGYLIVEKSALPDYFLKVVETRQLLESGECAQVSEAVKQTGISRSTYYKYKDRILEPSELTVGRKAVLSMLCAVFRDASVMRISDANSSSIYRAGAQRLSEFLSFTRANELYTAVNSAYSDIKGNVSPKLTLCALSAKIFV